MSDDNDNVTKIGGDNQNQKGKKTPEQIMKEINQSFANEKASDFKKKATEKMKEIEKLETSLRLAKIELEKMVEEYQASISTF